jgi:hypothetical protein
MAYLGRHVVVIGAGMGGLAAAGALSDFFGRVIVLDRDKLPSEGVPRSGVPQGAHTHGLLLGGLRALQMLFPGIDEDFRAAGAVTIDAGRDLRMERPGFDPFPARTLGIPFCCLSRPAIEFSVRKRVGRLAEGDLTGLADAYFSELPPMLEAPWAAASLDLVYPQTEGERPPDFERQMRFVAALIALGARDADVHSLLFEVSHLIKPRSVYREPAFQERVRAVLAEMTETEAL